MEFTNGRSKAFFGGLLWGDKPVRFVFMDEAGISAHEPVTVVVGLIASADEHVMSAEALVHEILGAVPRPLQDGFVFSAKSVMGNPRYQKEWSLTDRLNLVKDMMSVPRRIGMALCVSAHWRNAAPYGENEIIPGMRPEQFEHYVAFANCVAVADRNIRKHAGPREVATVVAEDNQEMRQFLKKVPQMWRENPLHHPPGELRTTATDERLGYMAQSGDMRVTRIRNSVHFVEKAEDPIVQVADACAFGFRRFFAEEKFGEDFAKAIMGHMAPTLKDFEHKTIGAACFWSSTNSAAV